MAAPAAPDVELAGLGIAGDAAPDAELAGLGIAEDGLPALSVAELASDVRIINSFLEMFTGSDGTMRAVLGAGAGDDLTFEAIFDRVREYDPAGFPAGFDSGILEAKRSRKGELQRTVETMRGIGLTGTNDFKRFEHELQEVSRTVGILQARHDEQLKAVRYRLNAAVLDILQRREEASPQLFKRMCDGTTTLSQALGLWAAEARGRL